MNFKRAFLLFVIIATVGVLVTVLVDSNQPDEPDEEQPTSLVEPSQTVVPQTGVPPGITPEQFTPHPTITNFISPTPPDQEYSIITHSVTVYQSTDDLPEVPEEGSKWFDVAVTMINMAGYPIEITPNILFVIDEAGTHHAASDTESISGSELLGATLDAGDAEYGIIRFELTEDVTPLQLIWCVHDDACTTPIYAELPVLE